MPLAEGRSSVLASVLRCGARCFSQRALPWSQERPATREPAPGRRPTVVTALALLSSTGGQSQSLCLSAMTAVFLLLTLELQKELRTESRPRRCRLWCGSGPGRGPARGWVRTTSVAERGRDRPQGNSILNCPVQISGTSSPSQDIR